MVMVLIIGMKRRRSERHGKKDSKAFTEHQNNITSEQQQREAHMLLDNDEMRGANTYNLLQR